MKLSSTESLQWPEALVETTNHWLAYQPIFSIKANEQSVIAFESLLRLSIGGVAHGPAEFVAAAESDGSIVSLDRWVLNEVIRLAAKRPRLNVWVNASQISIGHHTFLDQAVEALINSQTIGRINFEITETADINAVLLARRLDKLKVRALTVMIDDVRDGYAKRSLLHNEAVAGCKLSRETTIELQASERVRAEVQGLVKHCRMTGKNVVLEGVENEADLRMALDLGINICQGYHFGYPAEPEKLHIYSEMNEPE